jgi:hypothetical protein
MKVKCSSPQIKANSKYFSCASSRLRRGKEPVFSEPMGVTERKKKSGPSSCCPGVGIAGAVTMSVALGHEEQALQKASKGGRLQGADEKGSAPYLALDVGRSQPGLSCPRQP